ncbi:putative phage tail protein [Gluconacetobacter entanii]|uniref:putative phage tail protein n=1 Tax=Gluconacetobacter entanii TaxID=108528 RepID=UPI0030B8181A
MSYSAADFLAAFQRHLPTGPIWPREAGSNQATALGCLMPTLERLAQRDENLLIDAFPATTVELLPEWQASLGLPDACAGTDPTIEQQRAQVVARLTDCVLTTRFTTLSGPTCGASTHPPSRSNIFRPTSRLPMNPSPNGEMPFWSVKSSPANRHGQLSFFSTDN